ncbi:MAG TPA: hypothetical protein VGK32_12515 [Vicinamibacterales bacterium]|jgi:hypothetical protein
MDSAPRTAIRRPELVTDGAPTVVPTHDAGHALAVVAVYQLSEAGRKASLLAGGDGRAVQEVNVQVPATRLHLVSVDAKGVARLKLRPRFQMDADQRVVRVDAAPTYDAPPTLDDLFREAARNHELERVYQAERTVARAKKRDAERDRRSQLAEAFLEDKTQRALVHPAPSPKGCVLATDQRRVYFDVATDEGLARDVPPEAHRRFRADLQAKKERNQQERAAQLALHEEKKRYIADWIAKHGTPDQRERQAAGMLPMAEAIETITDQVFAALAPVPVYPRDGVQRLQTYLRQLSDYKDVVVSAEDIVVNSRVTATATAEQWAQLREIHSLVPEATAVLRTHRVIWNKRAAAVTIAGNGILVTRRHGPLMLRREYDIATKRMQDATATATWSDGQR